MVLATSWHFTPDLQNSVGSRGRNSVVLSHILWSISLLGALRNPYTDFQVTVRPGLNPSIKNILSEFHFMIISQGKPNSKVKHTAFLPAFYQATLASVLAFTLDIYSFSAISLLSSQWSILAQWLVSLVLWKSSLFLSYLVFHLYPPLNNFFEIKVHSQCVLSQEESKISLSVGAL